MIRILHSVSYMSRGGIETMLMNYYRHIDRTKVQFDFLCNSSLPGAYDEEILSMGGRIFRSPGFSPLKRSQYKKFMKKLFADHPEYQIIEAHNGPLGRYALKAAKDSNIPVRIYHAHGCDIPFNLKWFIKYYCKSTLKYSMNEHFVCGIKAGEYYMGHKVMESGNYHFIPNAIEPAKFAYDTRMREKMRSENNLQNKLIVGHIGRLSLQKNHPFIIEIFAELHKLNPDTHLVLVGEGEWREKIETLVKSKGLTENVTFTGSIPNPYDWYQAFDLFLMPSLWEGLPVVGVEAQTADLPAIFSTAVTPEIKLTEKTEFMSLKQAPKEWAVRINEILNNLPQRKDRTEIITANHYNIDVEAENLQNLYLEYGRKTGLI